MVDPNKDGEESREQGSEVVWHNPRIRAQAPQAQTKGEQASEGWRPPTLRRDQEETAQGFVPTLHRKARLLTFQRQPVPSISLDSPTGSPTVAAQQPGAICLNPGEQGRLCTRLPFIFSPLDEYQKLPLDAMSLYHLCVTGHLENNEAFNSEG